MATKAEQFRYEQQRKGAKKPKTVKKVRTRDDGNTDTRNVRKRADGEATAALENSTSGRPSRKSTRKSANGGRNDITLARAKKATMMTPKARAQRNQVRR